MSSDHGEKRRMWRHSLTAAPAEAPASRTMVSSPRDCACAAPASPMGPAPIITTGCCIVAPYIDDCRCVGGIVSTCVDGCNIDRDRYDGVMTVVTTNEVETAASLLSPDVAAEYAEWFGSISDPTRLRLLHAVASSPSGAVTVG